MAFNKDVKKVQEDLISVGITIVGTADGYFGNNTEKAIKIFNKNYDRSCSDSETQKHYNNAGLSWPPSDPDLANYVDKCFFLALDEAIESGWRYIEGIIAGIAMYNEHRKPRTEKGTFNGRAINAVENAGGSRKNVIDVHTGKQFINALIELTKKGDIQKLYISSHSSGIGLYGNSNSGFYSSYTTASMNNLVSDGWADFGFPSDKAAYLSDLKDKINSKEIKFKDDGFVVFLGCNTATEYALISDSFAENFSEEATNLFVLGAEGYSAPNDKDEASFIAREKNNSTSKKMDWIQFKNGKEIKRYGSVFTIGEENNE